MKSSIINAGVAMFALGACATTDNPAAPEPPASAPDACPIVQSADWKAWVNRMPGPGATPTLIVEGQVTLPTPGYTIELKLGRADRSMTPVQQLILVATPPAGQVIPTLTPLTARIAAPAIAAKYKAVQIVCNGEVIAQVTDVPDAF
jgi:hypothetical protein